MMPADLCTIECEPPGHGIEAVLAEVRQRVEAGEVSSLAIAIVNRDGTPDHLNSHCPSYSAIIGSIERMKYRMIREAEED